jgi:hypothetical protein
MYARDIRVESPQEALVVEQALAMYREMRAAAAQAPDGAVLSIAESLAVARGRDLTRKSLEAVLEEEIESSEKKGRSSERAAAEAAANIAVGKRDRSSRRPAR